MLLAVIAVILFIVIAMMWPEGIWTNAITCINVFFAGLIGWNYFELAAGFIEGINDGFTYVADFLAFWAVFAIAFNVCRTATDQISKNKVRFRKPVDVGGGAFFAIMTAIMFTSIVISTLHFAPLGKAPFKGSFAKGPDSSTFIGMQIENLWLSNMFRLARKVEDPKNPGQMKGKGPLADGSTNPFDPDRVFKVKYAARRTELEEWNKLTGSVRSNAKIRPKN